MIALAEQELLRGQFPPSRSAPPASKCSKPASKGALQNYSIE